MYVYVCVYLEGRGEGRGRWCTWGEIVTTGEYEFFEHEYWLLKTNLPAPAPPKRKPQQTLNVINNEDMNQINSRKWYIQWNLNSTKLIWISALYLLCWFKIKDKLK